MVARYDVRTLGDLVVDDGTRVDSTAILTSTVLAAILEDASGEIEASLMQADRYTADELAALTGNSLALLKRLTCKIAMGLLWERRQYLDLEKAEEGMEVSRKILERLRKGEIIFDDAAAKDAGLPEATTPSAESIALQQLTVDRARGPNGYYPARRLPGSVSN